jgi:hypothetical protein
MIHMSLTATDKLKLKFNVGHLFPDATWENQKKMDDNN